MAKERLHKFLSRAGVTSRRKAEEWIAAGRVKVNGRPASIGDQVDPLRDLVTVDDERVLFERRKRYRYIMLNKPRGYLTSLSDPQGRRCVSDLLHEVGARVYPVGRLDRNSEGLLLLTDDGDFANKVMHPSGGIVKLYRVTIDSRVDDEQLATIAAGIELDGRVTAPTRLSVLKAEPERTVVEFALSEGRNREIRRMCEAVGLTVSRLKRVSIGPLKLGMLKAGQWRDLKPAELIALRNAVSKANRAEK